MRPLGNTIKTEARRNAMAEEETKRQKIIEWANNLKPFNTVDDIPDIPIVDKNIYDNYVVPNLIRCGAIPKDKLNVGYRSLQECGRGNLEW